MLLRTWLAACCLLSAAAAPTNDVQPALLQALSTAGQQEEKASTETPASATTKQAIDECADADCSKMDHKCNMKCNMTTAMLDERHPVPATAEPESQSASLVVTAAAPSEAQTGGTNATNATTVSDGQVTLGPLSLPLWAMSIVFVISLVVICVCGCMLCRKFSEWVLFNASKPKGRSSGRGGSYR